MSHSPETAFVALATSVALVAGPTAEVAPHQPEVQVDQQSALGATAAHALMHTETSTTTVTQRRPNAPKFSASEEATALPSDRQQAQFKFAVRRAVAGGHQLRSMEVTTDTSDEARNTPADRATGGIGVPDLANETLTDTTSNAVAPVYEAIAESVTGYEVPTHVAKGREVLHPELAAKVVDLAHEAKMSPISLLSNFNYDPAKLTQAARSALDVLRLDRQVRIEMFSSTEVALPELPIVVPAPRKKEPAHTLQEGVNQLPPEMGGPGYDDFTYGVNSKYAATNGITSAQNGTNQTPATAHGIKQPRPQNYSGAKGSNMPRNGRGRGGDRY